MTSEAEGWIKHLETLFPIAPAARKLLVAEAEEYIQAARRIADEQVAAALEANTGPDPLAEAAANVLRRADEADTVNSGVTYHCREWGDALRQLDYALTDWRKERGTKGHALVPESELLEARAAYTAMRDLVHFAWVAAYSEGDGSLEAVRVILDNVDAAARGESSAIVTERDEARAERDEVGFQLHAAREQLEAATAERDELRAKATAVRVVNDNVIQDLRAEVERLREEVAGLLAQADADAFILTQAAEANPAAGSRDAFDIALDTVLTRLVEAAVRRAVGMSGVFPTDDLTIRRTAAEVLEEWRVGGGVDSDG